MLQQMLQNTTLEFSLHCVSYQLLNTPPAMFKSEDGQDFIDHNNTQNAQPASIIMPAAQCSEKNKKKNKSVNVETSQ